MGSVYEWWIQSILICHSCGDDKFSQRTAQHLTYILGRNILKRTTIETRAMNSALNSIRCRVSESILRRRCGGTLVQRNVDPSLGNARVPWVGAVYAVLVTLEPATGTKSAEEREETPTGNQQLYYSVNDKLVYNQRIVVIRKCLSQSRTGFYLTRKWCYLARVPARSDSRFSRSRGFQIVASSALLSPSSRSARIGRSTCRICLCLRWYQMTRIRWAMFALLLYCLCVCCCGGCSLGSCAVMVGCLCWRSINAARYCSILLGHLGADFNVT